MTFSDIPYANSEYYSSLLPERPIHVLCNFAVSFFLSISSLIRIVCSCQAHTVCTCMLRFVRAVDRFVQITAPSSSVAASNFTLNEICQLLS